jgi:hypothetical protein
MKKKNGLKWLLFSISIAGSLHVKSQDNIVPASPEASALAKSINFPVGYNTGVPNISIPFYEIKAGGGMSISLGMSYNAGGFKINERASDIGLGWSLSTNIQISRAVEGGDDFVATAPGNNNFGGYYYNSLGAYYESCWDYPWGCGSSPVPPTPQEMFWIMENQYDRQPDRFYYSIPGKSGVFYWQKFFDRAPVAVTVPYTGVKIELVNTNEFRLTDVDGTVYQFGSHNDNVNISNFFTEFSSTLATPTQPAQAFATSWKCSRMISSSKTDTIYFTYRNKQMEEILSVPARIDVFTNNSTNCGDITGPFTTALEDINSWSGLQGYEFNKLGPSKYWVYSASGDAGFHMVGNKYVEVNGELVPVLTDKNYGGVSNYGTTTRMRALLPDKITFRGGELKFTGTTVSTTAVAIKNENGDEIKTIKFIHDNYGASYNSKPTRYLDEVRITNGGLELEKYVFNYNKYIFGNLQGGDAWGGVNDYVESLTASQTTVPMRDIHLTFCNGIEPFTIGVGGTGVHAAAIQSGILKRITYPTGGYTDFTYSPNMYRAGDGTLTLAGGLRIEKIQYYDGSSQQSASEKIYKYGEDEDGAGKIKIIPNIDLFDAGFQYKQTVVHTNGSVEEKTSYVGSSVRDMSFASGAPVHYTMVTEYQKDMGQFSGKTVYEYDKDPYNSYNPSYIWEGTNLTVEQSSWHMGKLKKETVYKYSNGIYDWIKQKTYGFTEYAKNAQVRVEKVFLTTFRDGRAEENYDGDNFIYLPYGLKIGTMLLTWEEEKSKESGHELTKTTSYYYDNISSLTGVLENLKPTRTYTTVSGGKTVANYITYLDATSKGIPFLPAEQVTAVIDQGIEKITAGRKMEYRNDGLTEKSLELELSAPLLLDRTQIQSLYKEKLSYSYDNRANLTQLVPKDNIPVAYIWDYNKVYPIAEVKNVNSANEVAYTSFEADGTGGWSGINATNIEIAASAVTGQQQYNLTASTPLVKSGLNSSAAYIVTYWSKNGSYAVNGAAGTTLRSLTIGTANWTCYLHKINNPAAGTITINGSGKIDEVRLYPSTAVIATYAYTPLLGMNAQCDQNNRITRYYYDRTRLDRICDENGNIIKKYCYNYQGQPEICTVMYRSIAKSGTFTKQCNEGGTGSVVVYQVAEGAYTSVSSQEDANLKAQNDINTRGQAYADSAGFCTWYNDAKSVAFIKNNCTDGGQGSSVNYPVNANKYSSVISKADANQQAQQEINQYGQIHANDIGVCTWYNNSLSAVYYNETCQEWETPFPYQVSINPGSISSLISKQDANQKAQQEAQNLANTNGLCTQKVYVAIDVQITDTYENSPTNGWKEVSVYLRFYKRSDHSQPFTLPRNIRYSIRQLHHVDYLDHSEDLPNVFFEGEAPAGASEFKIEGAFAFYDYWQSFDDDGNIIYAEFNLWDYELLETEDYFKLSPVNYPSL